MIRDILQCKIFFYLLLGGKLLFQVISLLVISLYKLIFHHSCMLMKNGLQYGICDIRLTQAVIIEPYSSFPKFIYMNGQGWNKLSQDAFYSMYRYAPDPEK